MTRTKVAPAYRFKFLYLFVMAMFVCCENTSAQPLQADHNTYLAKLITEFNKTWPDNRTINIVVHGHSVPAGYFKTPDVRPFDAYPHLLHRALKERYPHAVINVIVTAIGGENSVSGADRFEKEVLTHQPDLILIDYGLNDRSIDLEAAAEAWRKMIRLSAASNIPVILLTPTADTRANMLSDEDPLTQHAEQIRRLASESSVALADSYAAVVAYIKSGQEVGSIMSQVNHPNRRGHELVLTEILKWFP